jgi:putative OmpL-like beta-barrel porin-2
MRRGSLAMGMFRSSALGLAFVGAFVIPAYAADLEPGPALVAPPPPADWWSTVKFDAMVEGGFTGNPAGPPNPPGNFGQLFTDKANMFLMNQLLLTAHRDVDETKSWDVGFKFQFMYGTDARYTRYLGEFPNAVDGNYAPAIQEAWVDVKTPWFGKGGTDFKVGQFVTPLGVEVIDPRGNFFYSHSYLFDFGLPFENTGVLAVTHVSDTLDLYGGIDTGVNTTFGSGGDPTGTVSFNAGFGLNKLMNGKLTILALTHIGPSDPSDSSQLRYLSDIFGTYKFNDKLTWTTELNYAFDSINGGQPGWGVVNYLTYAYNDWLSWGVRGEVWRDSNGFWVGAFPCSNCFYNAQLGLPNNSTVLGAGPATYTELTFGLNIKPFSKSDKKWLASTLLRPEIRWDHSFDTNAYDNFTEPNQLTLASDFIITFQ